MEKTSVYTVLSLTQNVAGWSLQQFSSVSGKLRRGPVFFWFSDALFKEAAILRKIVALTCALNRSPNLVLCWGSWVCLVIKNQIWNHYGHVYTASLLSHVLYTLSEVWLSMWLKHGVGLTFIKTIKQAM